MRLAGLPPKQGLYDPRFEHDACGVGFVVHIKGERSHEIVDQALTILRSHPNIQCMFTTPKLLEALADKIDLARYGIKGIPTLILFSGGKEVERVVGATSKESISRMIEKHVTVASA